MSLRVLVISFGLNLAASGIITIAVNAKTGLTVFIVGVALILIAYFFGSESAPAIIPLRYDSGQSSARQNASGQWCNADGTLMSTADILRAKQWINLYGLIFRNHGDPAFEIRPINNVPVGKSTMIFDRDISDWTQGDGEGFLAINMKREDGSGLLGGLFEEMREQDIVSVPVTIRYLNSKGHRYKTTCVIERNVRAPHGLSVAKVRHSRDLLGFLRRN
jgi:hypothetical protein